MSTVAGNAPIPFGPSPGINKSWGQEGGVDTAAELLRRYDPATRSWNLPRTGEFWDAVRSAHALERLGAGHTIAVVDDGFDMSIPALAEQTMMWNGNRTASVHGTVVALLILAVAPRARLMLYPIADRGRWEPAAIERALHEIDTTSATIVNLSLGEAHPTDSVHATQDYLRQLAPWPEMSEADVPFWFAQGLGELDGWRTLVRAPRSIFEEPIAALDRSGRTVVAATGNARGHIYDPALRASVFSVSFHRIDRAIKDSRMEIAASRAPTFSQSEFSDFSIIQPPNVLGSSFATPLISGFAALLESREDLRAYAEVARLAAIAGTLLPSLKRGRRAWSDRRDGVIERLFLKALRVSPHSHSDNSGPCPECEFFAAGAFIDFGLFKFNWGDLDGAEYVLGRAEKFAPANPFVAANLGMVYARRAQQAQKAGDVGQVSKLLRTAEWFQQKASQLRPEHKPYQRRAKEFMLGAQHPRKWKMKR